MSIPIHWQQYIFNNHLVELCVPDSAAVQEAYLQQRIAFPYWSRVWPAARALARFIQQHPHYVDNKKVVELGAGLGLPSLVAARYAASVLCTDHAPEAVHLARQSARKNQLHNFTAAVLDWRHLPAGLEAEVLLLSDINYEPAAFAVLRQVVDAFLQRGTTLLLSTPQRLMAKEFIGPLLPVCTSQDELSVADNEKEVRISVFVLEQ